MNFYPEPPAELLHQLSSLRLSDQYTVLDGTKVVLKALKDTSIKWKALVAHQSFYEKHMSNTEQLNFNGQLFECPKSFLNNLTGLNYHQGVLGLIKTPMTIEWFDMAKNQVPLVLLDGLCQAENVGALIRSGVAFNWKNFIYSPQTCPPYLRRVIRVSMGQVFSATHSIAPLLTVIPQLQEQWNYNVIACELHDKAIALNDFVRINSNDKRPLALVLGHEGRGVNPKILERVNNLVQIPLQNDVASLNVAISSSLFFHSLQMN